ncbi:MAG: DUF1592 domain-containing protein [Planctomycetaceae bacterium]
MKTVIHPLLLISAALTVVSGIAVANEIPARQRKFFTTFCLQCHGPETQEADFRVDSLLHISETAEDAEYWQLVLDNLHLGEMPPEGERQPSASEVESATTWIEAELRRARQVLAGQAGEVVLRRLNRTEYEYTIEDLFGVRGDFADGFPADATAEGFDNNGAALMLSATQIDAYLTAADFVLERAIETGRRPKTNRSVFTLHDFNREAWKRHREQLERRLRDFDELTPDEQQRTRQMQQSLSENPHDGFGFPVWENGGLRVPTPEDGPDVDAVIAIKASYAAPDTRRVFSARHAGWYRFRITAFAVRNDGEPVRLKISHGSFRQGTIPEIADVLHLTDDSPQEFEYRVYLQPNHIIKLEMIDGENWAPREKLIELPGPFIVIRSMEMEGPLIDEWPPQGHQLLLGKRDASQLNDDDLPTILAELAPRLFRRPSSTAVIDDYVQFYRNLRKDRGSRKENLSPLDAFRLTVRAMLASPHFLYHIEPGERPDNYALANRLSYFLWRSCPDAELLELAAAGRLSEPDVLRNQVDRLLNDRKSDRFLSDFVGQWLGIDLVGEMQPDGNLYPEYDDELERAMAGETEAFIREMLTQDLPLSNLIDSNWAMLNDRMARHYGIGLPASNQPGGDFRRVSLNKADTVRGGLLAQASILNITSNGTTTSPVVRGVWVLERLLGTPAPPPPPDVPAIEPDIRGASTIQEQMERHRSIAQCASCHRKIDPYGIALENFDVIGGWRNAYRALQPTANPNRPRLVDGPTVISSDVLPRRGAFEDFHQFRRLLLEEQPRVDLNLARQLTTFALGRSVGFADEEQLRQIVSATQRDAGGMKTMIRELVQSELFRKP